MSKGVSLYISIMILTVVLSVILGLTALLINQIRAIRTAGQSVVAIYAADSGIEEALVDIYDMDGQDILTLYQDSLGESDYGYETKVYCCEKDDSNPSDKCDFNNDDMEAPHCEDEMEVPAYKTNIYDCKATRFCIISVGTYKNTKRAIEVSI